MAKKLFDRGGIQLNYCEKRWENGFLWNLYTYSILLRLTHKTFNKARSVGCFLPEKSETELGVALNLSEWGTSYIGIRNKLRPLSQSRFWKLCCSFIKVFGFCGTLDKGQALREGLLPSKSSNCVTDAIPKPLESENCKSAKGTKCSQYKSTAAIFSLISLACLIFSSYRRSLTPWWSRGVCRFPMLARPFFTSNHSIWCRVASCQLLV
jgi:hypothetical protein